LDDLPIDLQAETVRFGQVGSALAVLGAAVNYSAKIQMVAVVFGRSSSECGFAEYGAVSACLSFAWLEMRRYSLNSAHRGSSNCAKPGARWSIKFRS